MTTYFRWLAAVAFACATIASNAFAAQINVLWYTYADIGSEYRTFYKTLVDTGQPHAIGNVWNLTFWGPNDPTPDFSKFNLLVIHSGESFRTGAPGKPNATPNYSGILANKAGILAARGSRTIITGTDADFHAVRGDSGVCGLYCFDGALGYVINAVNWAGSGDKLGILSFVAGNFPNTHWWEEQDSFLKDEIGGYDVGLPHENTVVIDDVQATYPMNQGLTSLGMSNWNNSFHRGFVRGVPGFTATMNSGSDPAYVLSLAKEIGNNRVVVEYVDTADFPNSPGGHFFYSSEPAEQAAVDAGSAGAFIRTGRTYLIGGTSAVCRFYGSVTPGPNSHFFTVDPNECNGLKAAQVTPTPAAVQQWNYEGIGYMTTPATIAADGARSCPNGTLPLYRAYNNAYPLSGAKNPWDSNHRYTLFLSDIAAMVALGWRDEGIVICAAAQ